MSKELVNSLDRFIDKFREDYSNLNEEERNFFKNYINLCAPCQIDLFLLDHPVRFQLLLVSHSSESKDKEIILSGPFKPQEFLAKLENFIINDEKWRRVLPREASMKSIDDNEITYGNVILERLTGYFKNMNNLMFLDIKEDELSQISTMFVDASAITLFGDFKKFDYTKFLEQKIVLSKQFMKNSKESKQIVFTLPPSKSKSKESTFIFSGTTIPTNAKGYGVMFYPTVWIEEIPKQTLMEQVMRQPLFRKKMFDLDFMGRKLIFSTDGFIGIESNNKEDAMKIFNAFFGVAHLFKVFCFAVNEDDLAEITIDKTKYEIITMSMSGHSERMQFLNGMQDLSNNRRFRVLKKETIKSIVDLTNNIINDQLMVSQITFLLEGYTYFINSEYSQSFILNWLIIEKFLATKWDELLNKRGIGGNRKKDFNDVDKWDAYHKLELLNFVGDVGEETYLLLRDFNTKRNHLVHKGEQIKPDDAEKLYYLTFNIVKDNLVLKKDQLKV